MSTTTHLIFLYEPENKNSQLWIRFSYKILYNE